MGWSDIQQQLRELMALRDSGAAFESGWARYCEAVHATRDNPPYHLIVPLRLVTEAAARRPADEIKILDHGCGAGGALLYFFALGFRGIYGVDIGGKHEGWNRLLAQEFGITEQRFFTYDGRRLPFDDNVFDVVISEEVVEHVPASLLADYYTEGARVLRPDGIIYYTVPHRLGPYDSHTRTWLVHYLPRRLALVIYGLFGESRRSFAEKHLFLRWPGFHRRMLNALHANTLDLTEARLRALVDFDYYDGPRGLRRRLGMLARLPGLGRIARAAIGPFLMRQTISRKSQGHLPTVFML